MFKNGGTLSYSQGELSNMEVKLLNEGLNSCLDYLEKERKWFLQTIQCCVCLLSPSGMSY